MQISARNTAQIGTALLRFRRALKLTQAAVGERVGLEQKILSSVERGAMGTRLGTLCKILAALDLEIVIRPRAKE